ncbi:MAG: PilZ domain-containing protein [Polyangiaceae bacterium]|nr:PilZ domain-containing protein [Polyangiaceae bacterium]
MDEKRQNPRLHTIRLVAYSRFAPDQQIDHLGLGSTLDLSEGGLRMSISRPLERGEGVELEFALDDEIVRAHAKVVHVEAVTQYVVGLEFDGNLAPRDLEQLRRHVPQKSSPGKAGPGETP